MGKVLGSIVQGVVNLATAPVGYPAHAHLNNTHLSNQPSNGSSPQPGTSFCSSQTAAGPSPMSSFTGNYPPVLNPSYGSTSSSYPPSNTSPYPCSTPYGTSAPYSSPSAPAAPGYGCNQSYMPAQQQTGYPGQPYSHCPQQPTAGAPPPAGYPPMGVGQPVPQRPVTPQGYGPAASYALQIAVLSPQFCFPQQTKLVMQEHWGLFRNDDFTITDTTGRPFFALAAAPFSLNSMRQLLDANGVPLIKLVRNLTSLHGSWYLNRASDGARLAKVQPVFFTLTPSVKVYLNDGDREPDFIVQGNFLAKKFTIYHRAPGRCGDIPVASVQKEGMFASGTAFMMSVMTDAQKYYLTIEPGVDAAFITALATLCDEIYNDKAGA